jgi:hypothetical protein
MKNLSQDYWSLSYDKKILLIQRKDADGPGHLVPWTNHKKPQSRQPTTVKLRNELSWKLDTQDNELTILFTWRKKNLATERGGEGIRNEPMYVYTYDTQQSKKPTPTYFRSHVQSTSWLPHIIFTSMLCVTWKNKSIPDCWNILAACPEHRASHYDDHLDLQDISSLAWL